ncbi:MAG: hypothetical protein H6954_14935 [Chromatiaceae bacterium]|nr:hypothetical protein [Chromatiaceae bacterium]
MAKCKSCLITDKVAGVEIGADGTCNLCKAHATSPAHTDDAGRVERQADLEKTLADVRGGGEYDCLVPLSGGKDSVYLLHKLKTQYPHVRVLAYTTDVNIPDIAWHNIRTTTEKLEIDHLVYRPPESFYRKVFRYILRNQEERGAVYSVSYVYAPLFEGDAIKVAVEKDIPLILAGYSPGQPEPERMLYEFSRQLIETVAWTPPELAQCGEFSEDELKRFFDPARYPAGTCFPRYLAPYHAWPYDQDEIMKEVVRLGLVKSAKHASPIFSNYPINWLLMYSDIKHFGYNPYMPEFSALIREGKASLNQWRALGPLVDFMITRKLLLGAEVKRSMAWLDLDESQLAVNRPRGAYDPPVLVR